MPKVTLTALTEAKLMRASYFMCDASCYGRPLRAMNVIDESNQEILAIEIDIILPSSVVVITFE